MMTVKGWEFRSPTIQDGLVFAITKHEHGEGYWIGKVKTDDDNRLLLVDAYDGDDICYVREIDRWIRVVDLIGIVGLYSFNHKVE